MTGMFRREGIGLETSAPVVAAVVSALVLFVCIGHASHASMGMGASDELLDGVGICLVVASLVAATIPSALPAQKLRLVPAAAAPALASTPVLVRAVPARASPAWLQRFRD